MTDIAYEIGHGRPVIVGVGKQFEKDKAIAHYEVVIGYEPDKRQVLLLDPALGWQVNSFEGFGKEWSYRGCVNEVYGSRPNWLSLIPTIDAWAFGVTVDDIGAHFHRCHRCPDEPVAWLLERIATESRP